MQRLKSLLMLMLLAMPLWAVGEQDLLRDKILAEVTGATIPDRVVGIEKFGARGDGRKDCKPAFDKAMKYAQRKGGARVVVPKGVWRLCGPIHLVSNVCLDLQEGAVLSFDATPHYYLPMVETSWEGTFLWNYSPFIYGHNLHDVAIIGKGVIDGNSADTFSAWHSQQKAGRQLSRDMNHRGAPLAERRFGEGHYLRPQLIQLYGCQRVTLEDFFMQEAPFWCVHLLCSENVVCRGLRYDAKLTNNDGIDVESSCNVLIEDIHFNNGDDNVAIKSGRDNDGWTLASPSANILMRRCHLKGLHGLVIGSEMSAGVENVLMEDCDFAGYCKRGVYVKTNPDRGGFVRNLYINNVRLGEVLDLFYVTSQYAGEGLDNHHFTAVENIQVNGLTADKVNGTALVLQGTPQKPIKNVSFRNVSVGEVQNGLSIEHTEAVTMDNCFLGPRVGVPSQASAKDGLFVNDRAK